MKNLTCALLVALFMTSAVAAVPAEEIIQDSIQCGDELGPGGVYVLDEDLNCDVSPALTVLGETHLDMNGHTLTCEESWSNGIELEGQKASITNGKIVDCIISVWAIGLGKHHISRIEIVNVDQYGGGFALWSDDNRLVSNRAFGCSEDCFAISSRRNWLFHNYAYGGWSGFSVYLPSSDNRLLYNTAERPTAVGYYIYGVDNLLIGNKAVGSLWEDGSGFDIFAARNRLWRNRSTENTGHGFRVSHKENLLRNNIAEDNGKSGITIEADTIARDNTIVRNKAHGNGDGANYFDLNDAHQDCDDNTWENNRFDTRNIECIE